MKTGTWTATFKQSSIPRDSIKIKGKWKIMNSLTVWWLNHMVWPFFLVNKLG